MRKQLQKFFAKKKNNKGFTLIELIIVIAILAILVGIVGMASIRYVEKARKSADQQTLDSISTAVQAALIDPENNLTIADSGNITVEKSTDGKSVTIDCTSATLPDSKKWDDAVKADLAKTPTLKSQFFKDGAHCLITYASATNTITIGEWEQGATPKK